MSADTLAAKHHPVPRVARPRMIYRSKSGDFGNFGDVPPCSNVDSANDVSVTGKAARKAFEL